MTTYTGSYGSGWTPSGASVARKIRALIVYTTSKTATQYSVTVTAVKVQVNSSVSTTTGAIKLYNGSTLVATDSNGVTFEYGGDEIKASSITNKVFTYDRGVGNATKTIKVTVAAGSGLKAAGTCELKITVPALDKPTFNSSRAYRVATDASGVDPEVDNTATRGYFDCSYTQNNEAYAITVDSIMFGEVAGTATVTDGKIYGYSPAAACAIGGKTKVTATIMLTSSAGVSSVTIIDYIYPQLPIIDVCKGADGYYRMGLLREANQTAELTSDLLDIGGSDNPINMYFNGKRFYDHIIAEGSQTIGKTEWTYRKYANGECELWGTYTASHALTTSGSGGYTTSALITQTLPFSVSKAIMIATCRASADFLLGHASGTTLSFRPYRMNSSSSASRTYYFYVKGNY